MADQRQGFLDAIKEDPRDETVRLIFADWLDEHGEHDEAERQRDYLPSLEWLENFSKTYKDGDYFAGPLDLEELLRRGRAAVEQGWFDCGAAETMCGELRSGLGEEFWKHLSVLLGVPNPDDGDRHLSFSCGC